MSASSRRAAISAAPGTGTATPARSATRRRWCTCRCSRKRGRCLRRSTPAAPRSSRTASASAASTASTTRRSSTPKSATSPGTRRARRGSSAPIAATRSRRSSSAWAPGRCTCRSCRASPASSHSRAIPSTPAAGTTATRAAIRRARRWPSSQTSAWPSSAPVPRRFSACRTSPGTAGSLFVFQRTPSSVDVRANAPIDPDWFATIATPGWQQRWLENFTAEPGGRHGDRGSGARRLDRSVASHPRADHGPAARAAHAAERCWRPSRTPTSRRWRRSARRVDAIVAGPRDRRSKLKAWYRQLCKRPCFHDEYLQAFNQPNTTLVDTDGKGVERITERGVVVGGHEYRRRLHHLRLGVRGGYRVHGAAPASSSRGAED